MAIRLVIPSFTNGEQVVQICSPTDDVELVAPAGRGSCACGIASKDCDYHGALVVTTVPRGTAVNIRSRRLTDGAFGFEWRKW